jgi:hypothetical protein
VCDDGWWGKGIYVSYDAEYSGGYSEDGRLIVCVSLCGKVYNCVDRRDGGELEEGYDSHVAEDGSEWVLFESSQVLPLFVIEEKEQKYAHPTPGGGEKEPEPAPKPPKPKAPPKVEGFACPQCNKVFKTEVGRNCHMNNLGHSAAYATVCKFCMKKCKNGLALIQHVKDSKCEEKHGGKEWKTV